MQHWVSRQLPPEENCPPLRAKVSVKVRVSFRVGRQPDIIALKEIAPWLGLKFGLGFSFGVGGQFSLGANFLEPQH